MRRSIPIAEGVRERYKQWLLTDEQAVLKLQAFGIRKLRAIAIYKLRKVPTLREALAIDCATNGEVSVYDWAETEYMVGVAQRFVSEEADRLFDWPTNYPEEARKHLRQRLVRRLSSPGNNALAITTTLGRNIITKEARRQLVYHLSLLPISIEDDDPESKLERLRRKRERLRDRRLAFIKGTRSGH
jgi:hypothetical protein